MNKCKFKQRSNTDSVFETRYLNESCFTQKLKNRAKVGHMFDFYSLINTHDPTQPCDFNNQISFSPCFGRQKKKNELHY